MPVCATCGEESPEGFSFCGRCGARLAEAAAAREERKLVTVLYADLVGSTARAETLDPEDVRAYLAPYHARLRRELERHGGTVEKFIGDAVVAVFGAPVAHEDDPERAVRAALAIQEAVAELNEADPGLHLEVRIGVTTGEALVALDARPEAGEGMVSGDVMNTGARVQAAAPPGGILVGEATYRATAHVIAYEEAEPVAAKGKARPVAVWRALEPRARLGLDVRQPAPAPLVGRQLELELVLAALARSQSERETQLVTLVGVPGIGKSRLVFETLRVVDEAPELVWWRQGRCLPYGEGVTFWALGEMVKAQAGILDTDSTAEAAGKLRRALEDVAPEQAEELERHLRPLVGLAREGARDTSESFAAWRAFFESLAELRPLVLVFEDLHWADDGMLDFVDHLADWARGVPILVLATARPELLERRPGWGGGKLNATTLALSPLSDAETAELVGVLAAQTTLPADVRGAVLARAAGNPLYAEQYVRMLADRAGDPSALDLPETVQGIIAARLDALPPGEKTLLQRASVIGKVFWQGALVALGDPDDGLELRLHGLERKDIVRRERRSSVAGETEYAFRHALLRDVAYGQIPRGTRSDLHRRAAGWIETLSERVEDRAEMLAYHWGEAAAYARQAGLDTAGLDERARAALADAAERATALGAFHAAARFHGQAAELWPEGSTERTLAAARRLISLFDGREPIAEGEELVEPLVAAGYREEAALLRCGLAFGAWNAGRKDDSLALSDSAAALVRDESPSSGKALVLSNHARLLFLRGEGDRGVGLATEALAVADAARDLRGRAEALVTLGSALFATGEIDAGVETLERGIRHAQEHHPVAALRGLNNLGSFYATLGRLGEAWAMRAEALAGSERLGIPYFARWMRVEMVFHDYWSGDWARALDTAAAILARAEAGESHYMDIGLHWARSAIALARDEAEAARREADWCLDFARDSGDPQNVLPLLAWHGRVLAETGDLAGAVAEAEEVLAAGSWDALDFWAPSVAAALDLAGRGELFLASEPPVAALRPWWDVGAALAAGRYREAAERFHAIGSLPDEAWARLRGGRALLAQGARAEAAAELERALAFWRSVGATRRIREAEVALGASV